MKRRLKDQIINRTIFDVLRVAKKETSLLKKDRHVPLRNSDKFSSPYKDKRVANVLIKQSKYNI